MGDRNLLINNHQPAQQSVLHELAAESARSRRIVLAREFYLDVLAGRDCFLIRPIMNILGETLRPVSTRARAQGGSGGLLWAFFPGSINADVHLLRSCPYGDPGDQLMISTSDTKDAPLTVTVLESYPHRILGTTEQFIQSLMPSTWGRLGNVKSFHDHWEHSFGRVFKLKHEPWAWVIRFGTPPNPSVAVEKKPEAKSSLLGFWRPRRGQIKNQEVATTARSDAASTTDVNIDSELQDLVSAQKNAMACLENAVRARRENRADDGWRMMNVAYRILSRATKEKV